jgi:hypothetical protein
MIIIGLAIAEVGLLWPWIGGLGSAGFPTTFSFSGKASPSTRRFSHFVTSMTAPVASGWSVWPGAACTHWKAPPSHGAHVKRSIGAERWTVQLGNGLVANDGFRTYHLRRPVASKSASEIGLEFFVSRRQSFARAPPASITNAALQWQSPDAGRPPGALADREDRRRRVLQPVEPHHQVDRAVRRRQPVGLLVRAR